MIDPAYDSEDYKQDAQIAILNNRLTWKGIGTAITNAKWTHYRKQRCRQKHQTTIWRHQQQFRQEERDPTEIIANQELATTCARKLYDRDPKLLSIILMRALGMSRTQIALVTGQSMGTISRAPHRATLLCQ